MERELKIVFSIFLVFFIFALTTFFNIGSFFAPYFLSKTILVVVALMFALINLKSPRNYFLWLYFFAAVLFAITDENTIGFFDQVFHIDFFDQLSASIIFLAFSFIFYFSFHFSAVLLFYFSTRKKLISICLGLLLALSISLLFTEAPILQAIAGGLFFIIFFITAQRDSELKNKTLRVLSYQYLLLFLLGSFEYFL